jgi:hypothetical protein
VKRAYKKGLLPRAEALTELQDRGYSSAQATIYLDS